MNRLFFTSALLLLLFSCHKELFTEDPADKLSFSSDSIRFDTVFTSLGSATQLLKIYNPHKKSIRISSLKLASGEQSMFRLNVDGLPGSEFQNIEINPNDSIYLFCVVTINPDAPLSQSPFIVTDSIIVITNQNEQHIILEAFGQNANYFPAKNNKGQIAYYDLQNTNLTLDDSKPYVFYGITYFDHGTLIVPAGKKIYVYGGLTKQIDQEGNSFFYNDGRIYFGPGAHIEVQGTLHNPVIFQGVRLEEQFKDVPGQWSGIFLDKFSKGNIFNYAIIKNNQIGIYIDSLAEVKIENCIIQNNSAYGLLATHAVCTINNSLFFNQGQESVAISDGGNYILNYCTLANFGNTKSALSATTYRCIDFPLCNTLYNNDLILKATNCIITGSDEDELAVDSLDNVKFDLSFDHCLIRIKDLLKPVNFPNFMANYTSNSINSSQTSKLFKDLSKDDYHLDTLSVVEMKAVPIPMLNFDLEGIDRDNVMPDIGCFEYHYK